MSNAFQYTILSGDTYSSIADGVNACQGVTVADIEAANPGVPPSALQVGMVINIPVPGTAQTGLRYTILAGDSYWAVASGVNACAGVTAQSIEAANPGISPTALQVGQVVQIPAAGAPPQPTPTPVPAPNIGYWSRTWMTCTAPAGATMGIAFSGWVDPTQALADSARVYDSLVGTKYIALGGGNDNGKFTAAALAAINAAINAGSFSAYQGLAYDVEEGDAGLSAAFQESFALAKAKGLKVLVTVSHSAPYGIADAQTVMTGFFADPNIDFLSPQLYTTGSETANEWAITAGVGWNQYASAKAAVIPSIVSASMYPNAQETFATYGVTTQGYVVWNC